MLNAIGLQGIGVHRFIREKLPELHGLARPSSSTSVGARSLYVELARILSDAKGVAALELNISCPNIKEGGITFGCSLNGTFDVERGKASRVFRDPEATPNVTDVASFARASEDAGARVSLVNTFLAMAIDTETRRPILEHRRSGPAIRPIRCAWSGECRAVKIPAIGMGGIASARCAGVHHCRRHRVQVVPRTSWTRSSGASCSTPGGHAGKIERAPTWSEASIPPPAKSRISPSRARRRDGRARDAVGRCARDVAGGFKVGNRPATSEGPAPVHKLVDAGARVFRPSITTSRIPWSRRLSRRAHRGVDDQRSRVRRSVMRAAAARRATPPQSWIVGPR
jgi:hypothetical protein